MFFCTGCQNVRAIEPVALPVAVVPPAPVGAHDAGNLLLDHVEGERDAGLATATGVDVVVGLACEGTIIEEAKEDEPLPLPPNSAELPTEEEIADALVKGCMPVNRGSSSFDNSIYSQEFTIYPIASSEATMRVYKGDNYVTIDTEGPFTVPISSLRTALNSIEQDPEKKRLEGSLLFMSACLVMSLMFHYKK